MDVDSGWIATSVILAIQYAKKVLSDSQGLVDCL